MNIDISKLADVFEANNITSFYSTDYDLWGDWYDELKRLRKTGASAEVLERHSEGQPRKWHKLDLTEFGISGLSIPRDIDEAVTSELRSRVEARRLKKRADSFMALDNEAIRAWLSSLSDGELAAMGCMSGVNGVSQLKHFPKRPPKGYRGRHDLLDTDEVVRIGYRQNAYDDTSYVAIPIFIAYDDLSELRANIEHMCSSARSTNGLAGYGSSYSIHYIHEDFVVIAQRSSIAD